MILYFCQWGIAQDRTIPIYMGSPSGSEDWEWTEAYFYNADSTVRLVYNVSQPVLEVFFPEVPDSAGTSVIICPGGGFQFLSIDSEGYEVAKWLNNKGITAFVLKYRLSHSMSTNPIMEFMKKKPNTDEFNKAIRPIVAMAIQDGKEAISYVRKHVDEFNLNPKKIGILGFSAGGTVATGVSYTYDEASRPDFSAPIYPYIGSFEKGKVPDDAPPLFILAATDDYFGFQNHCIELYREWNTAGKNVEMHLYAKGDHGFGMNQKGLPVDSWIDRFYDWLNSIK